MAVAHEDRALFKLLEDDTREVLCRRVDARRERLELVEKAVVKAVERSLERALDGLEIDEHAELIELGAGDECLDLPGVAVQAVALARVIDDAVCRFKGTFDFECIHMQSPLTINLPAKKGGDGHSDFLIDFVFLTLPTMSFMLMARVCCVWLHSCSLRWMKPRKMIGIHE